MEETGEGMVSMRASEMKMWILADETVQDSRTSPMLRIFHFAASAHRVTITVGKTVGDCRATVTEITSLGGYAAGDRYPLQFWYQA